MAREKQTRIAQRKIKEAFYQCGGVQDSIPELHGKMHEYQRDGVAFALALKEMGRKGCLIADEMGLGKTLQALAVCKYLMEEAETPLRVCVISPGLPPGQLGHGNKQVGHSEAGR